MWTRASTTSMRMTFPASLMARLSGPVAIALLTSGCGATVAPAAKDAGSDASAAARLDAASDIEVPVEPCGPSGECPTGTECLYRIGSCSAPGECVDQLPDGSPLEECNVGQTICGCGNAANTGCGYPQGYASAPTTGAIGDCGDGGP
jgi:hypothetical protein